MNTTVLAFLVIAVYCISRIDAITPNKTVGNEKDGTTVNSVTTAKPNVQSGANKPINLKVLVGDVNFDIKSGNHKNVTLKVNTTGEEEEVNVFMDEIMTKK